mmetsp:Transcript_7593/g.6955  ORF Transcript_7593/g.6955 Transcript_7593/m.6955 type:complete len:104 (+) Transcript_7593:564-875(+)
MLINPSNPCGSAFTKKHQLELIELAKELKLPIIADEVYHGLVYDGEEEYESFACLTKEVPILSCGALSKVFCVPGWRLGWVILYNYTGYFDKVKDNLGKLMMI